MFLYWVVCLTCHASVLLRVAPFLSGWWAPLLALSLYDEWPHLSHLVYLASAPFNKMWCLSCLKLMTVIDLSCLKTHQWTTLFVLFCLKYCGLDLPSTAPFFHGHWAPLLILCSDNDLCYCLGSLSGAFLETQWAYSLFLAHLAIVTVSYGVEQIGTYWAPYMN